MLFPDTSYGYNSGGDPEAIPELTWEKFREQYAKCYHPSNARVYLDGSVPMDKMLPLPPQGRAAWFCSLSYDPPSDLIVVSIIADDAAGRL